MDITHVPRHVTCEVCLQKDSEEFMIEISGCFVHNPECMDEWAKMKKEIIYGTDLVE